MLPSRPSTKDRKIASELGLEFEAAAEPIAKNVRLISAITVRKILGNVSDMTLWRWIHSEEMAFPKPIVLARNRYWNEARLLAWIEERATQHIARASKRGNQR